MDSSFLESPALDQVANLLREDVRRVSTDDQLSCDLVAAFRKLRNDSVRPR